MKHPLSAVKPERATTTEQPWWSLMELALIGAICLLYLFSFDLSSPLFAKSEIFDQDSFYIHDALEKGKTYPWNPQHHLLYHTVVEKGYELWSDRFGGGSASAFRYLKLFTALTGLAFLLALRFLFREFRVPALRRICLLIIGGLSVSAWFHFSAFETYCLAMPPLVLYFVALHRLVRQGSRRLLDRFLLVGSLAACILIRTDLGRFAAATAVLLLLPSFRNHRKSIFVDLVFVGILGVLGSFSLAGSYFQEPLGEVAPKLISRSERRELWGKTKQPKYLASTYVIHMGRAAGVYSHLMPHGEKPRKGDAWRWENIRYFSEPLSNMRRDPMALLALAAVLVILFRAAVLSLRAVLRGDAFHLLLFLNWVGAWLFFTWFNPLEPFLWILPFLVIQLVALTDASRCKGRFVTYLLVLAAALQGAHNLLYFYLPFR